MKRIIRPHPMLLLHGASISGGVARLGSLYGTPMHAPLSHQPPARPTLGLVLLLGALTAFGAVSIDLYLPALPAIAADFAVKIGAVQATMSAFFIGMAIGQLVYGPLSDRIGRRPPLLIGAAIYTLASLGCAMAPSLEALIVGRFAQALGACAGVVVARAVVSDRFDTVESARLFSLLFLVLGVAPLLAPSLGAVLLHVSGWRAIFFVLAGFGLAIGVAIALRLPESRTQATADQAADESAVRSYLEVLKTRRLMGFLLAGAFNGAALFTYISSSPVLFIGHFGVSPLVFGWIFAGVAVGLIGSSQVNRALLQRFAPTQLMQAGSTAAVGFSLLLVAFAVSGAASLAVCVLLLFLSLASYGFVVSNSMALALSLMPTRAGAISALIGSSSFAFGAIATGLLSLWPAPGPLPMALGMAFGFVGCWLSLHFLARISRWNA